MDRYIRQTLFRPWGAEGQQRLSRARVGLVGCGGLGATIATLLVRAGVGFLRLIDGDQVSLDNLHRQVLYREEDVGSGRFKAEIARERLSSFNSTCEIDAVVGRLDAASVGDFVTGLDVIADGTDNFATRFLINETCVKAGIPWVYGGVAGSSGMTMTIVPQGGPCLRCVFADQPPPEPTRPPGPAVINTVVAVIAAIQATEVFKLILDPASCNRGLLTLDLWDLSFCTVDVERDPLCPVCGIPS